MYLQTMSYNAFIHEFITTKKNNNDSFSQRSTYKATYIQIEGTYKQCMNILRRKNNNNAARTLNIVSPSLSHSWCVCWQASVKNYAINTIKQNAVFSLFTYFTTAMKVFLEIKEE